MTDKVKTILDERGLRYGASYEQFHVAQGLKRLLLPKLEERLRLTKLDSKQKDVVRESVELIATKLSRVVCGDPGYADNWDDISGYAQIVVRDTKPDYVQQGYHVPKDE